MLPREEEEERRAKPSGGGRERGKERESGERGQWSGERGERAPHTHTHPQAIAVQTTLRGHESGTWEGGATEIDNRRESEDRRERERRERGREGRGRGGACGGVHLAR